jgi:hypothetical protein
LLGLATIERYFNTSQKYLAIAGRIALIMLKLRGGRNLQESAAPADDGYGPGLAPLFVHFL